MPKKPSSQSVKAILHHPDLQEIIGKISTNVSDDHIAEWLAAKYCDVKEAHLALSKTAIKTFRNTYLDVYSIIQKDIQETRVAVANNNQENLQLAVANNPTYKDALMNLVNQELDVDAIMSRMAVNIENRLGQVFDSIQEDPRNINVKLDRLVVEYAEVLGGLLDKYYRWKSVPIAQTVNNTSITVQVVDQHISVFHDVMRDVLSQMDLETSLYFIEIYNQRMAQLKMPTPEKPVNTDVKLAEVQILNETINEKLNQ
jgi:hypothetical protein